MRTRALPLTLLHHGGGARLELARLRVVRIVGEGFARRTNGGVESAAPHALCGSLDRRLRGTLALETLLTLAATLLERVLQRRQLRPVRPHAQRLFDELFGFGQGIAFELRPGLLNPSLYLRVFDRMMRLPQQVQGL